MSNVEDRVLTQSEARELTDQIAEGLIDVHTLIVQAWEGQAWRALGHASWDEWIDANFRGLQLRPPREQRAEVIQSMRAAGMSVRAIAQATDLGYGTVQRASGDPNGSPGHPLEDESSVQNRTPERSLGVDGKSYTRPAAPSAADVAAFDDVALDDLGIGVIDIEPAPDLRPPRPVSPFERPVRVVDVAGEAVVPAGAEVTVAWWEGPRAALLEAESRCVRLLEERKAEPRLVEDPADPGAAELSMAAARTVLAAGGVIVDLHPEELDAQSRADLQKVLGRVIEALDGVLGDLEAGDAA
ncbi:hypothetical protein FCK90_10435 [Kocuria coralli]|uniref:Uncharacterized protein n=1 Tax=Kocuria coralli TaxID=1461025 RepID=A0A5J5KYK3_9MICC|nr:hypothetical protein [Kocuria coralli]KAA9393821.1 hypothetical protein FCK90_10435 [Kocuria coralli]